MVYLAEEKCFNSLMGQAAKNGDVCLADLGLHKTVLRFAGVKCLLRNCMKNYYLTRFKRLPSKDPLQGVCSHLACLCYFM